MSPFGTNDELFSRLRSGNRGYDVIVPSHAFVERLAVPGAGGVIIPPPGYWQRFEAICRKYGILRPARPNVDLQTTLDAETSSA